MGFQTRFSFSNRAITKTFNRENTPKKIKRKNAIAAKIPSFIHRHVEAEGKKEGDEHERNSNRKENNFRPFPPSTTTPHTTPITPPHTHTHSTPKPHLHTPPSTSKPPRLPCPLPNSRPLTPSQPQYQKTPLFQMTTRNGKGNRQPNRHNTKVSNQACGRPSSKEEYRLRIGSLNDA